MDPIVVWGIGGLAVVMAVAVAAMVRMSDIRRFPKVFIGIVAIMAIQLAAAQSGLLRQWDRTPPPLGLLLITTMALTTILAFSRVGDAMIARLPIALIIGVQAIRLPLELVMHRAATHGIMPPQMTYTGLNFDIVTGILALPVAWLAARGSRFAVIAWNILGSLLLATIVTIAVISLPPVAAFGPDKLNTFVADPPFVWLPGVLVPAALLSHLLLWRKLAQAT